MTLRHRRQTPTDHSPRWWRCSAGARRNSPAGVCSSHTEMAIVSRNTTLRGMSCGASKATPATSFARIVFNRCTSPASGIAADCQLEAVPRTDLDLVVRIDIHGIEATSGGIKSEDGLCRRDGCLSRVSEQVY